MNAEVKALVGATTDALALIDIAVTETEFNRPDRGQIRLNIAKAKAVRDNLRAALEALSVHAASEADIQAEISDQVMQIDRVSAEEFINLSAHSISDEIERARETGRRFGLSHVGVLWPPNRPAPKASDPGVEDGAEAVEIIVSCHADRDGDCSAGRCEVGPKLEAAIARGKAMPKLALYCGCWDEPGHYFHRPNGLKFWDLRGIIRGLLKNGRRPDQCDGKVFWTAGGSPLWYAFYWWDRSRDKRIGSNSGFYVRGFGWPEAQDAFDYAAASFPSVVARQAHPLILQGAAAAPATPKAGGA